MTDNKEREFEEYFKKMVPNRKASFEELFQTFIDGHHTTWNEAYAKGRQSVLSKIPSEDEVMEADGIDWDDPLGVYNFILSKLSDDKGG